MHQVNKLQMSRYLVSGHISNFVGDSSYKVVHTGHSSHVKSGCVGERCCKKCSSRSG